MGTGQEFVKKLGLVGAVAVLALGIFATVLMFTAKGGAVAGYEKPEGDEYYREHLEELAKEIETNLLPKAKIEGVSLQLRDGVIAVTGEASALRAARSAIGYYYDEGLFEFTEVSQ